MASHSARNTPPKMMPSMRSTSTPGSTADPSTTSITSTETKEGSLEVISTSAPGPGVSHPELLLASGSVSPIVTSSTGVTKKKVVTITTTTTTNSVDMRHPAIPPIKEEMDMTDLYEVAPEPLAPEDVDDLAMASEAEDLVPARIRSRTTVMRHHSSRKSGGVGNNFQNNSSANARWQHRSHSLPAVHGNFILLREKTSARISTTTMTRLKAKKITKLARTLPHDSPALPCFPKAKEAGFDLTYPGEYI